MSSSQFVKPVNQQNFSTSISKGVALIDFYASWCGPCRMLSPIIDQVADHFQGKVFIGKLDIDQEESLAREYQVSSIPTLILFKDGKEVKRSLGLKDFNTLKGFVDSALGQACC
jgi:thioredoxin 1